MNHLTKNRSDLRVLSNCIPATLVAGIALGMSPARAAGTNEVKTYRMDAVEVRGRDDSLLGVADSANEGVVGAKQLELRPLLRSGEILETVPGLIVSQHSGDGKANQYYLRGFNLDHGTDFATSFEGMPVNLLTHAHGQGYTDLNFLIPELVRDVHFRKGPYFADIGDFGSAGAADIRYVNSLPYTLAQAEVGSFGYARAVVASSPKVGEGHLLYGLDLNRNDGPWKRKEGLAKISGVLRYSEGDDSLGWSVTGQAYHGSWNSTDQVAKRAVDSGLIDRFGTLNPTDGGNSSRYSLLGEWHRSTEQSLTKISAFASYYDLDLYSDFTYFLDSPDRGDQFEQKDRRVISGLKASQTWFYEIAGRPTESTVGLQLRDDRIRNGLYLTEERSRFDRVRADRVGESSISPYIETKTQWFEKFRSTLGLRGDFFYFDTHSSLDANTGSRNDGLASPKLALVFGPWAKTEVYLNGGLGYHSNDGRGVTTRIDPKTGDPVTPADPLVRTSGAEIGVRTLALPNLQSSLSLWVLDIDSELLFVGDGGTTEASLPSRRYGVEFANYYTPTPWLTFDLDFSLSQSRFREEDPTDPGRHIPGSVEQVLAAGVAVHDLGGFFGSMRLRYFGPRALTPDDSQRSQATTLVNLRAGYEINKTWTVALEIFNLFDEKASDIDYFYSSQLKGEAGPVDDIHFHPAEPISFRGVLTAKF